MRYAIKCFQIKDCIDKRTREKNFLNVISLGINLQTQVIVTNIIEYIVYRYLIDVIFVGKCSPMEVCKRS